MKYTQLYVTVPVFIFYTLSEETLDKSPFLLTWSTPPALVRPMRPKHCSYLVVPPKELSAGSFVAIFPSPVIRASADIFVQLYFPTSLDK